MNLLRFRVIIDIEDDVFRDILIDRTSSLEDLHRGILAAFDFGEGEMASFFQSDEDWGRGREVPLMDMGTDDQGNPYPSMRTTAIEDLTSAANDRMVYVYDFLRMWCFYVEVIGVENGESPEFPLLAQESRRFAPAMAALHADGRDGARHSGDDATRLNEAARRWESHGRRTVWLCRIHGSVLHGQYRCQGNIHEIRTPRARFGRRPLAYPCRRSRTGAR